jgi:hypothetical protein
MSTSPIQETSNNSEANIPELQKLCIIQSSAFGMEQVWLLERIIRQGMCSLNTIAASIAKDTKLATQIGFWPD